MKKYTKRLLSMLLAVAMLLSLWVTVSAEGAVAKIGDTTYETLDAAIDAAGTMTPSQNTGDDNKWYLDSGFTGAAYDDEDKALAAAKTITLLANVGGNFDFGGKNITLDLDGYTLSGSVTNAQNVSAAVLRNYNEDWNSEDDIKQFRTLAATGVYKSVVFEDAEGENKYDLVADGFDKRTVEGGVEIFSTDDDDIHYGVVVTVTVPENFDRSSDEGLQVWAGDTVTVSVSITGARAAALDLTLKYNTTLFTDTTNSGNLVYWAKDSTDGYRMTSTGDEGGYFEAGVTIGNTFTFKANKIAESKVNNMDNLGWFNVVTVGENTQPVRPIFITKAYKDGAGAGAGDAVAKDNAINGKAYIIMQDGMSGSVEGATLTFNGTVQKLVKENTFSATNGSQDITSDSTIQYCTVTKDQYEGVQEINDGKPQYYTVNEYGATTENKTDMITPYPVYTIQPTSPDAAGLTYTDTVPTGTNAGDYYVFYKVSSDGYKSYYGKKQVTIAKQEVTLTWAAPKYSNGATTDNTKWESNGSEKFTGPYDAVGFIAPTATYKDWQNNTQNATVTLTSGPNEDELKAVGNYVFEAADVGGNYTFSNATCDVKVTGKEITGWTLTGSETQYNDGLEHVVATLTVAEDEAASLSVDEPSLEITMETSTDGVHWTPAGVFTSDTEGESLKNAYEKAVAAIPKQSATGTYYTRMTVKADNYETKVLEPVEFDLKTPLFYVETSEYVAGYTEIRVYTNDAVTFKYGDPTKPAEQIQMFDVSTFGYKYGSTWDDSTKQMVGGAQYTYVYALVIEGEYHDWIYASNAAAGSVKLPANTTESPLAKADKLIYDVNGTSEVKVSQEDYTAVQAIYNGDTSYLKNLANMYIVLRADVNRDKKVDTAYDVSAVKQEYVTNWNS